MSPYWNLRVDDKAKISLFLQFGGQGSHKFNRNTACGVKGGTLVEWFNYGLFSTLTVK